MEQEAIELAVERTVRTTIRCEVRARQKRVVSFAPPARLLDCP